MRYFVELSYNGKNYFGWQKQEGQVSIQSTIEEAMSKILRTPIKIVGCGRTDTGVHALQYFLHFDFEEAFPKEFLRRLNKVLPPDIAILKIFEVDPNAHARFDAFHRAYEYRVDFQKNPFDQNTAYSFPYPNRPDFEKMQQAAQLLLQYEDFFPFCKTNSDVKTMRCELKRSEWVQQSPNRWVYEVASNRFLRGMIRLIVGMCLNVGMGKIDIEEVKTAMDQQQRLLKSWSVPPEGLYLKDIKYPHS